MCATDLDNIGAIGGITGRSTSSLSLNGERVGGASQTMAGFGLPRSEVFETLLECSHLSEPSLVLGLAESIFGVLRHLLDSAELGWVDP